MSKHILMRSACASDLCHECREWGRQHILESEHFVCVPITEEQRLHNASEDGCHRSPSQNCTTAPLGCARKDVIHTTNQMTKYRRSALCSGMFQNASLRSAMSNSMSAPSNVPGAYSGSFIKPKKPFTVLVTVGRFDLRVRFDAAVTRDCFESTINRIC